MPAEAALEPRVRELALPARRDLDAGEIIEGIVEA